MIPDNVEKIIMTKDDYDRNVEQLLYDKCKAELEIERLNNIINKAIEFLKNAQEQLEEYHFDGYDPNLPEIIKELEK